MSSFGFDAVFDGEIVVLDETGISRFQLLQNYESRPTGQLRYFIFDILYLKGHDLRGLPIERRKQILRSILPDNPVVRYCDHVETEGVAFFRLAAEQGLEGVVAKRVESIYREGVRSRDWLKVRARLREELVVGGFTEPRGGRQYLGALLLGVYEDDKLVFVTHASGRLSEADLASLRRKLDPLELKKCPFVNCPKTNAPAHWV
jgi:bifunctional non-homologous end joining protein LigD